MKNNQETWRFLVQVAFSTIVLSFSLYKLTVTDQQDSYQALYWGGVTGIMAWWMPSPGNSSQNSSQLEQDQRLPPVSATANSKPPQPVSANAQPNVQDLPRRAA